MDRSTIEMDRPTIDRMVLESARKHRDRTALERLDDEGRRIGYTYGELAKRLELLARGMLADGVSPGDRVAIIGANSPAWGLAALATLHAGAILVPVDQKATRKELEHILAHSGATRLILTGACFERLESLPSVEKLYFLDRSRQGTRFEGIDHLATRGKDHAMPAAPLRAADDVAILLYTSGTTGAPKGVMLTHWNLLTNMEMVLNRLSATPEDAFTSILPLSHTLEFTAGFLLPLALGSSVHYVGSFNPVDIVKTMSTCGGTIMIAVPRLYQAMWKRLQERIDSLTPMKRKVAGVFQGITRRFPGMGKVLFREIHQRFGGRVRFWVSGGAPLDPAIAAGFAAIGIPILNGYGLTETSPVLAVNALEDNRPDSVGRPLPGVELKIFDANEDGIGEVAARGPNVTPGYYRNPEATRDAFRDGWFLTGDLGKLTPDGVLELRGRCKNLIVTSNGKKIHPEEIEEHLARSRILEDVAVVGVPESAEDAGEVVTAVVVPGEALAGLGERELEKRCLREVRELTAELSDWKRPRRVMVRREPLPKTHTMKVRRKILLEEVLGLREIVAQALAEAPVESAEAAAG